MLMQSEANAKTNYGRLDPDYNRNGIIGADNTTITKWANYAKENNRQIAALDEYLLYAKSREVLAIGSTAQSDTKNTQTVDSTGILSSVTADNGAIVGVFDYRGKTAFYVVSYDTTNPQTISLNFNDQHTCTAYSEQSASVLKTETTNSYSVDLFPGGGAFIVLD